MINLGTETLVALINTGGHGQPILTAIRLEDIVLILEDAVPAALPALIVHGVIVQGAIQAIKRALMPRGLRLEARQ